MRDPGRRLAVVGFVLAFVLPPAGVVVCHVARRRSGALAFDNTLARAGSIIGWVLTSALLLVLATIVVLIIASLVR